MKLMKHTLKNSLILALTLLLLGCFASLAPYKSTDAMRSEKSMTPYKDATDITLKLAPGWVSAGPPNTKGPHPFALFKKKSTGSMSIICYSSPFLSKPGIQKALRNALKTQYELTGSGWKNIGPLPLSIDVSGQDPEFEILRYNTVIDGNKIPMVGVHAWRLDNLGECKYGITANSSSHLLPFYCGLWRQPYLHEAQRPA
jgi:hypothetical protein